MAFLHICFKGDVSISHAALTHFAHRHTRDSWVKHLYVTYVGHIYLYFSCTYSCVLTQMYPCYFVTLMYLYVNSHVTCAVF